MNEKAVGSRATFAAKTKTRMKARITNTKDGSAEVYLYGEIGRWMDVDATEVVRELERMQNKEGVRSVTFYVNSGGGDVMQGLALYNYLNRCGLEVTWVVDGIAASMMAMLMSNPKHTVKAARYAKLMYHRVTGYVYGNSDEIRSAADMVDTFEADLVAMMAERTGKAAEEIRTAYFDGIDHWLSVTEAVDLGLVDEITDGDSRIQEAKTFNSAHEVCRFYESQIINLNHQNMNTDKRITGILGLPEDSGTDAVCAKLEELNSKRQAAESRVTELEAENRSLAERLSQRDDEAAAAMVDAAITAKKIDASQRESFLKLARQDYASTKAVLDGMKGVEPIAQQLEKPAASNDTRTWDELHKAGELEKIKSNNPERFNALYKAKFGHSPKNS